MVSSMWKKVLFACSILLGLALFAFFIGKALKEGNPLKVIGDVGWIGVSLFVLNAALVPAAPAVGWAMLMRAEGLNVPVSTALKAAFMGFPINFVAPSMYLGAEPLKVIYVAKAHDVPKRRVLATIVVSKFQEVGSLLLVMLVAAGIALWRIPDLRRHQGLLIGAMGILVVCFGLGLYSFIGNFKPTEKFINLLARLGVAKRKLARLRSHAREMEHIIHRSFTRGWRTFLAAQAVTLVSAVSILLRPWIFFYFMNGRFLGSEYLCAIYVVTNLINMVPHTPGGLGIFEGGMLGLFNIMNLSQEQGAEQAAAFSLMTRIGDAVLLMVGIYLIIHLNMRAFAKSVTKGEQKLTMKDAVIGSPPGAEAVSKPAAPSSEARS